MTTLCLSLVLTEKKSRQNPEGTEGCFSSELEEEKIASLELSSILYFSFKFHFSVYYSLLIILRLTLVGQDFEMANHELFAFTVPIGSKEITIL